VGSEVVWEAQEEGEEGEGAGWGGGAEAQGEGKALFGSGVCQAEVC